MGCGWFLQEWFAGDRISGIICQGDKIGDITPYPQCANVYRPHEESQPNFFLALGLALVGWEMTYVFEAQRKETHDTYVCNVVIICACPALFIDGEDNVK